MKIKLVGALILAFILNSCGTTHQATDTASVEKELTQTYWVMETLYGQKVDNVVKDGKTIGFKLNPKGNGVAGFAGCNNFMGGFTLMPNHKIDFTGMASTRMACPQSDFDEGAYLNMFENVSGYALKQGKLILTSVTGEVLATFTKKSNAPIVGKYWKLIKLNGKEVTMGKQQEKEIYFMLKRKDHRVTGFAGCNNFSGSYTLEEGQRIRFSQMAATLKACPDLPIDEAEFLKVFELANNYTVHNDTLSLNVGRRAPLAVFKAVYF